MKPEFFKAGNKLDRGVSFVIYADPGVGKTTMCSTLPVGETVFIDCEAGLGPLMGSEHVVFRVDKTNPLQIEEFYKYLRTEKHPFKNVVFDNISDYEAVLQHWLTTARTKQYPDIRERGDVAYKVDEIVLLFRDLVYQGINVVMVAWGVDYKVKEGDGVTQTRTGPKVSNKVQTQMVGRYDIIGHLEVDEKSGNRWLLLGPDKQYLTKTHLKGLDTGEPAEIPAILEKLKAYNYGKEE